MNPLLSGHLKSTRNGHFYCCQPVLNGRLLLNSTTQHARHRKCERLLPSNLSIFILKSWLDERHLICVTHLWIQYSTVKYCFLFRFVCIELVSLIWFLQIWVAIYVYGTMINWSTLIKKLMQTYIVIVSGSILNVSTVHLNGIWHLIWRYLSKPVLGGHPVLSGHYSIPRGCPLNTGFTVITLQIILGYRSVCDGYATTVLAMAIYIVLS